MEEILQQLKDGVISNSEAYGLMLALTEGIDADMMKPFREFEEAIGPALRVLINKINHN